MVLKEIVIFGGTGNTGGATIEALLAAKEEGIQVGALVRDASSDKAKALKDKGVTLVEGSFDDKASLKAALENAEACFLCCSNTLNQVELETNVIEAAEASDTCQYLVKVSTCQAQVEGHPPYIAPDSMIQYGQYHAAIEDRLKACGSRLQYTCLRPNVFMQNCVGDIFGTIPSSKSIVYPQQHNYKCTLIDVRDIGLVAAKLLLLPSDKRGPVAGKALNVCGPDSVSLEDLAQMYSQALGTKEPIQLIRCDAEGFIKGLEGVGFPNWLAASVTKTHTVFWDSNAMDFESSPEVLELLPKNKFRSMKDWVAEMAPMVKFAD